MKKKLQITMLAVFAFFALVLHAQPRKCATMHNLEKKFSKDPTLKQRMLENEQATRAWILNNPRSKSADRRRAVITIPTVVHVIWNDSSENVSDSQINSQMAVMNEDFRLLNADTLDDQHPFRQFVADAEIEFCLAQQDPDGNPTDGITRTQTSVVSWDDNNLEDIKSTANGGQDNWDPTKYLNIYVVNLSGSTLGFATFPDELATSPNLDGVVIRYEAFGTEGTAGTGTFSANSGGRTATHEVGHWLNLRHIWADSLCGDDFVQDTEPAEEANYGCPTFPHRANNQCGSGADGEMYMNYMDYVDDDCMNMFTIGQADRMQAALNGLRSGLLTSDGCDQPNAAKTLGFTKAISVFPNPCTKQFTLSLDLSGVKTVSVTLVDMLGATVKEYGIITNTNTSFDIDDVSSGVYYLTLRNQTNLAIKKLFITK
ncbi:MAG: M43 family zinc metalloprotease [Bacteroidota bacterium]|jgi:hypothetical protein